ncbi:MAG TPA: transposase [Candidatus Binatia bacterium]
MPRASRHFLPGYVWHITHRCHQREFLLKFARDRRRYLYWLFEAKKRYGLSVLNYVAMSNHFHLMVKDTGANVIAASMQLIAGRTAQEYNQRKGRQHSGRIVSRHGHRSRRAAASLSSVH